MLWGLIDICITFERMVFTCRLRCLYFSNHICMFIKWQIIEVGWWWANIVICGWSGFITRWDYCGSRRGCTNGLAAILCWWMFRGELTQELVISESVCAVFVTPLLKWWDIHQKKLTGKSSSNNHWLQILSRTVLHCMQWVAGECYATMLISNRFWGVHLCRGGQRWFMQPTFLMD